MIMPAEEAHSMYSLWIATVPFEAYRDLGVYADIADVFVESREGAIVNLGGLFNPQFAQIKLYAFVRDITHRSTEKHPSNRFIHFSLVDLQREMPAPAPLPKKFRVYKELPPVVIQNKFLCTAYVSTR